MPILVTRTFQEVDEESAAEGDTCDQGFVSVNVPMTFRELVDELKKAESLSSAPCRGHITDWANFPEEMDFDGVSRTESLHFSFNNPPRVNKYWDKALRVSGLIK